MSGNNSSRKLQKKKAIEKINKKETFPNYYSDKENGNVSRMLKARIETTSCSISNLVFREWMQGK